MTKKIKYYSSDDLGAPVLKQAGWGSMVNLYRQICVGYNEQEVESILYSIDDKTVTISCTIKEHGYRKYQTLLINAPGTQYHEKEFFIIKTGSNTLICQTKELFTEELISGNITCKVAPIGMIEELTDNVGKSAFKFEDPDGENVYMVINDTQPTQFVWNNTNMMAPASIYMCKNLDDIDGDSDYTMPYNHSYPNAHKISEWKPGSDTAWSYGLGKIMYQNTLSTGNAQTNNINLNVSWKIIGNGSFHYLYIYPNSYYDSGVVAALYFFGALKRKYEFDKYAYVIKFTYNYSEYTTSNANFYNIAGGTLVSTLNYNNFNATITCNISTAIKYSQLKFSYNRSVAPNKITDSLIEYDTLIMKGLTSENRQAIYAYPSKYTVSTGSGLSDQKYPNFDGSVSLSKINIYEHGDNIERGTLPGALWIHHNAPFANKVIYKFINDDNKDFYAICMQNISMTGVGGTSSSYSYFLPTILISFDEEDW